MRLVRCALVFKLFTTVAILLCCQIQAQNPKNKLKPKPAPLQVTPEPLAAKADLSKEFMELGRKAFAAIDRLNEHLLDTKDVISHGNIMELSDEKGSWVLRATTAEKASDDVQALAESTEEKLIARIVGSAVSDIQRSHNMVDIETEIAVHGWNLHVLQLEQEGVSPLFLGPSGVPDASRSAMDRATNASEAVVSNPCYLAAKEAVSTGTFDSSRCEPAKGNSQHARDIYAEQKDAFWKQLGASRALRAEGQTLIFTEDARTPRPPFKKPSDSPETYAATFMKTSDESSRAQLKSFGFTRIRLEIGGKMFEWPIE